MTRTRFPLTVPCAFAALIGTASVTVPAPARAQSPAPLPLACIDVELRNVRPGQGMLMVAAYDSEAGFAAQQAATALQVRAAATTMRVAVCGVAAPQLALTVFQDLNGNGKLDRNAFSMPTEPWGASGKPAPMSPPTWQRTQVTPTATVPLVIELSS